MFAQKSRKQELSKWAKAAVTKRDEKEHSCLLLHDENADGDSVASSKSAVETQQLVASGKLNAADHLVQLAKRCRKYGRSDGGVNAITEEFYDEAYEVAKSLAAKRGEQDLPPLFGVPISVKECIGMKGSLSTGGLQCRTREDLRSKQDSLIVAIVRKAGALPMVRGNVGQTMMMPESVNNIWGRTLNPWDFKRSSGGSSGGDGALVAMKCVPLAIGSDVAGSIRIPAIFCGIVGFKPTTHRLSLKGCMRPRKDDRAMTAIHIPTAVGPLARTVDDCALFMKSVCVPEFFASDISVPPLPFDMDSYTKSKPLKIGYFSTDGWFEPCQAAKRGLMETVDALTKAGHTCVPFDLPTDGWANYSLMVKINGADGNMRQYKEALEGEDFVPEFNTLRQAANVPNLLRPLIRTLIDKRRGHLIGCAKSGGISAHAFGQLSCDLMEMRASWEQAFMDAGIDAIIHPALPIPALPHGMGCDITSAFSYTLLANMLLWPAGVLPVTTIQRDEQHYKMNDLPADQRDLYAKLAAQTMKNSAGLPVSVAIMTPNFRDETCLRAMKEIESLVQFSAEPQEYTR
mmetsp:Transcript_10451/g.19049  ORF Transcript_10451/g.19049 Transcript_10451/m.19049 type:complete len:572 (+) Transcript_10451:335-2050(+)